LQVALQAATILEWIESSIRDGGHQLAGRFPLPDDRIPVVAILEASSGMLIWFLQHSGLAPLLSSPIPVPS
jgi:hypothetical protein